MGANKMKHLRVIGVIGAILLAGLLIVFFGTAREPQYKDRTLTEWLQQAQAAWSKCADPDHPERDPAYLACKIAVNQMGTNTIPFLLDDLLATESTLKPKIAALARQPVIANVLPRTWRGALQDAVFADKGNTIQRRVQATLGFALLEANANVAEPVLLKLIKDENRDKRFWGYCAFAAAKPAKEIFVPVAIRLLKDSDEEIRNT